MPPQRSEDNPDLLESILERTLGTGPLRRVVSICMWLLLAAGVVLAMGLGLPHLAQQHAQTFEGTRAEVVIENAPEWFRATPGLAKEVHTLVAEASGSNPNDRIALVRAHALLEKTGWFRSVERVHRESDGTIRIVGTMVHPFATVRWGSSDHLIDSDGKLLNRRFPQGQANPNLPLIIGARTPPPSNDAGDPAFGEFWPQTESMTAGMDLLHLLHSKPWFADIKAVDISAYRESNCLWLSCEGGAKICWGLGPEKISAAELTPAEKIHLIDSVCTLYGPLNTLTPVEIDVRHDLATVSTTAASTESTR